MNIPFTKKKVSEEFLNSVAQATEFTTDAPELSRCDFHNLFVYDDTQQGRAHHNVLSNSGAKLTASAFTEAMFHCWKRLPDPPPPATTKLEEEKEEDKPEEVFVANGLSKKSLGFAYPLPSRNRRIEPLPTEPIHVEQTLVIPLPKRDQNDTTEWTAANKWRNRLDHWAKIRGELWSVPAKHFFSLDKFWENGRVFRRTRVALEVPLRIVTSDGQQSFIERNIYDQEAYMYVGIPEFWEHQIDGGYLFQPLPIFNNSNLTRKYYAYTLLEDQDK